MIRIYKTFNVFILFAGLCEDKKLPKHFANENITLLF